MKNLKTQPVLVKEQKIISYKITCHYCQEENTLTTSELHSRFASICFNCGRILSRNNTKSIKQPLKHSKKSPKRITKERHRFTKSKKERQAWWYNLSDEERESYLKQVQQRKAIRREEKSRKLMLKYRQKYKCSECFHRKVHSCVDNLPNGCEHWFNPHSLYQGIKYG